MNLRKIVQNEILTTQGVKSYVLEDHQTIGHILLADLDGISKELAYYEFAELPGYTILWKSSNAGYHIWNLTIRSLEDTLLILAQTHSDCKHVLNGFKKKRWVLRITPKWKSDRGVYKDEPLLMQSWYNPTRRFQSKAHYRLFEAIAHTIIKTPYNINYAGSTLKIDQYMTITDEMKNKMRNK